MAKKNNDEYEVEEISLEELESFGLNEVNASLGRFSADGHSWNGRKYINYICRDINE